MLAACVLILSSQRDRSLHGIFDTIASNQSKVVVLANTQFISWAQTHRLGSTAMNQATEQEDLESILLTADQILEKPETWMDIPLW